MPCLTVKDNTWFNCYNLGLSPARHIWDISEILILLHSLVSRPHHSPQPNPLHNLLHGPLFIVCSPLQSAVHSGPLQSTLVHFLWLTSIQSPPLHDPLQFTPNSSPWLTPVHWSTPLHFLWSTLLHGSVHDQL